MVRVFQRIASMLLAIETRVNKAKLECSLNLFLKIILPNKLAKLQITQ